MVCHQAWDSFFSLLPQVLVAAWGIFNLCYDTWDLFVVACRIQFLDQGSNLWPLHWEHRVLATGPPRKSPDMEDSKWKLIFLCSFNFLFFSPMEGRNPCFSVYKAFILPYSFLYILPSFILRWIYYSVKTKPFPRSIRALRSCTQEWENLTWIREILWNKEVTTMGTWYQSIPGTVDSHCLLLRRLPPVGNTSLGNYFYWDIGKKYLHYENLHAIFHFDRYWHIFLHKGIQIVLWTHTSKVNGTLKQFSEFLWLQTNNPIWYMQVVKLTITFRV